MQTKLGCNIIRSTHDLGSLSLFKFGVNYEGYLRLFSRRYYDVDASGSGEFNKHLFPCNETGGNDKSIFKHQLQHSLQYLLRPTWPKHVEPRQQIHRMDRHAINRGWRARGTSCGTYASIVWDPLRRGAYRK